MRPTIKLIDTRRTTATKTWETEMYVHTYEDLKSKGKMVGWIPKDKIDSIETEIVEDAPEDEVIIEQLNDSDTEDTTDDIDLMNLNELKSFAKGKVKIHPATKKEETIREKLREAGY